MTHLRVAAAVCAAVVLTAAGCGSVWAQAYPTKAVRVIVGYPPGGGADIVSRLISHRLSERLGQQFVVFNTPGAGGSLGALAAARAEPDGYNLFLGQTAEMSIVPNLTSLQYNPIKDFAPIAQLTSYPYVIAVHPSLPFQTFQEFLAYAKARPGELNYGSPGPGSTAHLAIELFMRQAGITMTHVPFRGSGPALLAAIANHVQVVFGDAASTTSQVLSGQLRALAVTATKRSPLLPNTPTVIEAGLAKYEVAAWHGFFAPVKTDRAIIDKLNREINAVLREPDISKRFTQDGIEAVGGTPEAFGAYVQSELERWGQVAKQADIKMN